MCPAEIDVAQSEGILVVVSGSDIFCGALLGDSGRCTLVGALVKQQNSESCCVFNSAGTTVTCPERRKKYRSLDCTVSHQVVAAGCWSLV